VQLPTFRKNPLTPSSGKKKMKAAGSSETPVHANVSRNTEHFAQKLFNSVGFEIVTPMAIKSISVWGMTSNCMVQVHRRFGITYCLIFGVKSKPKQAEQDVPPKRRYASTIPDDSTLKCLTHSLVFSFELRYFSEGVKGKIIPGLN
jgi:hypothetical protein